MSVLVKSRKYGRPVGLNGLLLDPLLLCLLHKESVSEEEAKRESFKQTAFSRRRRRELRREKRQKPL